MIPKRMQKGLRVIILEGAIEKSNIAIAILENEWLDGGKWMIGWQHNYFVFLW